MPYLASDPLLGVQAHVSHVCIQRAPCTLVCACQVPETQQQKAQTLKEMGHSRETGRMAPRGRTELSDQAKQPWMVFTNGCSPWSPRKIMGVMGWDDRGKELGCPLSSFSADILSPLGFPEQYSKVIAMHHGP